MTDPGAQLRYLLPQQRSEQIFRDHVVPVLLAGSPERQHLPTAIVLSAQAGAGKTTLADILANRFTDHGGAVRLDVDQFKPFHPEFRRLRAENETAADDLVHADARRWFDQSVDYLAHQGINLLIEHGLRNREVVDSLLTRLTEGGYRVEAALMATPAAVSLLGILNRYQIDHEKKGFGRAVPQDLHDQRFNHLYDVADWLDADQRVATIWVPRRDASVAHRNDRDGSGRWHDPAPTREALRAERERQWTTAESEEFLRVHGSLAGRMAPQWSTQLRNIRDAAAPHLPPDAGRGPTTSKTAITYGRYQIVSIAHLDTIRTMLRTWPEATIGVIDLDARPTTPAQVPPDLADFYRVAHDNTAAGRNPMTVDERIGFWRAALDTAGLADRVSVEAIAMPESDPTDFNRRFPPERFDVVFPAASDAEQAHDDRSRIFGGRPIFSVEPPLEYHTSDIRASYRAGTDIWRGALAPGTLDVFTAAEGPRRVLGLDTSTGQQAARTAALAWPTSTRKAVADSTNSTPQQSDRPELPVQHETAERHDTDRGPETR